MEKDWRLKMKNGFTIIELMIVVSIVGILAAIAIPNFLIFQCRTQAKELQIDGEICRTSEGREEVKNKASDSSYKISYEIPNDSSEETTTGADYCTTPEQYEKVTDLHLACQEQLDKCKSTNCAVCEDQLSQCRAKTDPWNR